jgi:hypothetical protein
VVGDAAVGAQGHLHARLNSGWQVLAGDLDPAHFLFVVGRERLGRVRLTGHGGECRYQVRAPREHVIDGPLVDLVAVLNARDPSPDGVRDSVPSLGVRGDPSVAVPAGHVHDYPDLVL